MPKAEDFKFQKNDQVLGTIDGSPARGRVVAVKGDKIVITHRGPSILVDEKHMTQGDFLEREGLAEDFELLHRPVKMSKEKK